MRVEDKGFWFEFQDNGVEAGPVTIGTPDGRSIAVPMKLIENIWYLR